jgi:hypothetical protein
MSGSNYSPWDSAEFLTDDETIIEYLTAALGESDPLIFLKAARNVARARGLSSDELPDGASGLSASLEEEIRSILGQKYSRISRAGGCWRTSRPALGRRPSVRAAASQGLRVSSLSTWV